MDPRGWLPCSTRAFQCQCGTKSLHNSNRIVVTGGRRGNSEDFTYDNVAEYQLTGDFTETALTPMRQGRVGHACGVYQEEGGQQVRRVPIANFSAFTSFDLDHIGT